MIDKKDILAAFNWRHACKEFDTDKKLSDEDFNFILETARLSPSSFGFEPWQFVIVQNPELRTALKEVAWGAPKKLDTASHFVLGLTMKAPLMRYDSDYIHDFMKEVQGLPDEVIKGKGGFYEAFQKSDFHLDTDRHLFDWASKQCYIALGNMMTSAAMIGIDTCPIEGFKQEETEALLAEKFDVDTTQYGLSFMVGFGHRITEPRPKTRRAMKDIVTWK